MSNTVYAGFWLRVCASIIDTLILWIPCSLFRWSLAGRFDTVVFEVLDFIQLAVIWGLYYGFLESSPKEGTLGKQFLKLRVTDMDGSRLSFGRALGRYLLGLLAALPVGVGLFMVGWTRKKQGLHDKMAKCIVTKTVTS
jgi:uncharacterized RDD family membrane protein YckC